jgi:hypothetical protein
MYSTSRYLLLPLMWVGMTVGENRWTFLGMEIGQLIYWASIILAWVISFRTPYAKIANFALLFALGLRGLELFNGSDLIYAARIASLAFLFIVAGSAIYGRNPRFLHKQLVFFLALSIPILFLQVAGAGSFVMGWNTEFAHDPTIMTIEEIGKFKDIPTFPTLFVQLDELRYSIGQGRPSGLLYSNNVSSVFLSVAIALNATITQRSWFRGSSLIVLTATILIMSKLAFVVAVLVYSGMMMFGSASQRNMGLKLLVGLVIGLCAYYLLFPGLFLSNFSREMIMSSVLLRLIDLLQALGLESAVWDFSEAREWLGAVYQEGGGGYSTFARFFRSGYALAGLAVLGLIAILYVAGARHFKSLRGTVQMHSVVLLVCVLTLAAVPFVAAPSFQLLLGFGCFPLFKKFWSIKLARQSNDQNIEQGGAAHLI